jgi:hypothetical protein
MEKKLYRVKVVLFVMAENESDACVAATQARFDIFECSARKAEMVDPGWKDAIPYNSDDDRTCSAILSNKKQAARPGPRSGKLPAYVQAGIRAFDIDNRYIQPGQQT